MQVFDGATTPRFAVESAKRTKNKKAVFPRASYGLGVVAPSSSGSLVFTFDKIALAKGQVFRVYFYEKDGARNLVVTMNDEWERCEWGQNRLLAGRIVSALQARGLDASLLVPEETDISLPERCSRVNEWCR